MKIGFVKRIEILNMRSEFDDIRPYTDKEVKDKIGELVKEPQFEAAISKVFKDVPFAIVKRQLLNINTIREFQIEFILPILKMLVSSSTDGFSWSENEMDSKEHHLYISNHRDIVLDSALTNYALIEKNLDTAEIAIGSNLLSPSWVEVLVKLNKSFTVERNVDKEKKMEASMKLSSYIRYSRLEKNNSIWIAQREGRSKDGSDKTNPSLLKMFCLSAKNDDPIDHLKKLNIRTVSCSYEYNPCDSMTLPELYAKYKGEKYIKSPGEDMNAMVSGVMGKKGKVHIGFSHSINDDLEELRTDENKNRLYQAVAEILDKRIHKNYKLFSTNYIAFDLLNKSGRFTDFYSHEEMGRFQEYMLEKTRAISGEKEVLQRLFLEMYANPVTNKLVDIDRKQ